MTQAVIDLLLRRRSVLAKNLAEPGPNAEQLQTILAAGLRVPDHGRVEPWRIQVLHKTAQASLADVCREVFERENPTANETLIEAEHARMQRSPVLLVVSSHPDPQRFDKIPALEQLLSAGALCQNMLIAAQALGFGAQWVTDWPAYHPDIRTALGHSADTEIVGFVHVGTPPEPPRERARPDPETIISEWSGSGDTA